MWPLLLDIFWQSLQCTGFQLKKKHLKTLNIMWLKTYSQPLYWRVFCEITMPSKQLSGHKDCWWIQVLNCQNCNQCLIKCIPHICKFFPSCPRIFQHCKNWTWQGHLWSCSVLLNTSGSSSVCWPIVFNENLSGHYSDYISFQLCLKTQCLLTRWKIYNFLALPEWRGDIWFTQNQNKGVIKWRIKCQV